MRKSQFIIAHSTVPVCCITMCYFRSFVIYILVGFLCVVKANEENVSPNSNIKSTAKTTYTEKDDTKLNEEVIDPNLKTIDSIKMELSCSKAGGQCVIASDCPEGNLAETPGLCPMQKDMGVECCYGQSKKETRCRKLGVCMPSDSFCNERLIFHQATDCPENQKCCILTL